MGITHFDEPAPLERSTGHLRARWTNLGEAAGCVTVGVRRIEVVDAAWSTPAHDHGAAEEIFYVLGGRGLLWHDGRTCEIGEGDCVVCLAGAGAHSMLGIDGLDILAFGPRVVDFSTRFPRLGLSMIGPRFVESVALTPGAELLQFTREIEAGPPPLPEASGPRPSTIVNLADVEPVSMERPIVSRTRRNLGVAGGSIATGLQHVVVPAGKAATPSHCHSLEEEIFVVLDGDGVLRLGDEEIQVHAGNVISRPAASGVAHVLVAGEGGLTFLAYGTREKGDVCFYPRSQKVLLRGVGAWLKTEALDYWDGED